MKRLLSLAWLAAMAALPFSQAAQAQRADYDAMVATHAKANGVPEALVHRRDRARKQIPARSWSGAAAPSG